MEQLKWIQILKNVMYFSTLGYPVIIMMFRAGSWENEKGKDFRLAIYRWVYLMLIIQSSLWERNFLTLAYLMFAILPLLLLFYYQKKEYESEFTWWGYLKTHKVIVVVFLILLIGQWPVNRMVAGELLKAHHEWVEESMIEKEYYGSYNEYKLAEYEGEIHEYLIQYKPKEVQISDYYGTQIYFMDSYKNSKVSISYRLDGMRWELTSIAFYSDQKD